MPELIAEPQSLVALRLLGELAPLVRVRVPEQVTYRYAWRGRNCCEVRLSATHKNDEYVAEVLIDTHAGRENALANLHLLLRRRGSGSANLEQTSSREFSILEQDAVAGFIKDVAVSIAAFFENLHPGTLIEFSPWRDRRREPSAPAPTARVLDLSEEQLAVFTHEHPATGLRAFEIKNAFPDRAGDYTSADNDWLIYHYRDGDTPFRLPVSKFTKDVVKEGSWFTYQPATGETSVMSAVRWYGLITTTIQKDH